MQYRTVFHSQKNLICLHLCPLLSMSLDNFRCSIDLWFDGFGSWTGARRTCIAGVETRGAMELDAKNHEGLRCVAAKQATALLL